MFKKIPNKFLSIKLLANFYSWRLYPKKNWLMVTHFLDQQDVDYRENNKPGDIYLETYIRGLVFGKKYTLRWRGDRKSHEISSHANKSALQYTSIIKVGLIHDTIWYEVIYEYAACMIFWYFKIIQVRSNLWGSGCQISIVIKL